MTMNVTMTLTLTMTMTMTITMTMTMTTFTRMNEPRNQPISDNDQPAKIISLRGGEVHNFLHSIGQVRLRTSLCSLGAHSEEVVLYLMLINGSQLVPLS